jgi:hypothetical protein
MSSCIEGDRSRSKSPLVKVCQRTACTTENCFCTKFETSTSRTYSNPEGDASEEEGECKTPPKPSDGSKVIDHINFALDPGPFIMVPRGCGSPTNHHGKRCHAWLQ